MKALLFTFCFLIVAQQSNAEELAVRVTAGLDQHSETYAAMSDQIWQWAEIGYQETRSSQLLQSHLQKAGFQIKSGVADIPTAFIASYGSGKPVIALLAEYDALPNASQTAAPYRESLDNTAAGHACGHNLFGVASVAAAIQIKNWLEESKENRGTLRVYGTPAEEGGSGKVYMARDGLFDDVDTVIHWHPGDQNIALPGTTLANRSAKFKFSGISAHAAVAPERGRSALDGVEAMNHMVNMLREHVPQTTRIHYVITNGGAAPNIVPAFAEVYYYVRAPSQEQLLSIWERLEATAQGAAIGTGTKVENEVIHGVYNILPNVTLARLMAQSLKSLGGIEYSAAEQRFAESIIKTYSKMPRLKLGSEKAVVPFSEQVIKTTGSSDVGDVSWVAPTVGVMTATWVPGTVPHTWQSTAASGTSIGHKGMLLAAKSMALTSIKLFENPKLVSLAKEEWQAQRGENFKYKPLLGDRNPPLDYRN